MPHLESTYERIKDDFTVLAVATGVNETEAHVRAFVEENDLETPMAIDDGRLASTLNLRVTPVHLVIGRDGRILHVGHLADERLETALREAERQPASPAPQGGATIEEEVVSRLPDLTLTTVDGDELRLAPADRDQPTAILFFLPWCEGYFAERRPDLTSRCREVNEEVARRQAGGGARWIGVVSGLWETETAAARYRETNDIAFPLVLDASGELFASFGIRSTPVIIVFNPEGDVVARIDDAIGAADLHAALDRALGGSSP
jgi:peroxiredoxin